MIFAFCLDLVIFVFFSIFLNRIAWIYDQEEFFQIYCKVDAYQNDHSNRSQDNRNVRNHVLESTRISPIHTPSSDFDPFNQSFYSPSFKIQSNDSQSGEQTSTNVVSINEMVAQGRNKKRKLSFDGKNAKRIKKDDEAEEIIELSGSFNDIYDENTVQWLYSQSAILCLDQSSQTTAGNNNGHEENHSSKMTEKPTRSNGQTSNVMVQSTSSSNDGFEVAKKCSTRRSGRERKKKSNVGNQEKKSKGKKRHDCDVCGYSATNRSDLVEHTRTHKDDKSFKSRLALDGSLKIIISKAT